MNLVTVLVACLVFGIIFWLADKHLQGRWRDVIKFLAGAIIVLVLILFLLGLFGRIDTRI